MFYGTGGATCGSHATSWRDGPLRERRGPFGSADYHLGATSGADNYVPISVANSGLAIDFDGQARPLGGAREAGADER